MCVVILSAVHCFFVQLGKLCVFVKVVCVLIFWEKRDLDFCFGMDKAR